MHPAAPALVSMIALSAALFAGLLLVVVGAVLLAIDLGEPLPRKAGAAVGSGAIALGLALVVAGADPLCHWLVLAA